MFKNNGIYHTWLRICSKSDVFLYVYGRSCFNNDGKHRYLPHLASYMRNKYRVFTCLCSDLLQSCSKAPPFTTLDLTNAHNGSCFRWFALDLASRMLKNSAIYHTRATCSSETNFLHSECFKMRFQELRKLQNEIPRAPKALK
jgi:hypothetical protein